MASEVVRALQHAWVSLTDIGVPAAVMGGLAVATWKHVRATQDVDILVGIDQLDSEVLLSKMQAHGFRPKLMPAVLAFASEHVMQLLYEPPDAYLELQIDLLFAESEFQRQALKRSVSFRIPGEDLEFQVLSCEDLILTKLKADRLIDQSDVVALLRENRTDLDYRYLSEWLDRGELHSDWQKCWHSAFPGETDPTASQPSS